MPLRKPQLSGSIWFHIDRTSATGGGGGDVLVMVIIAVYEYVIDLQCIMSSSHRACLICVFQYEINRFDLFSENGMLIYGVYISQ